MRIVYSLSLKPWNHNVCATASNDCFAYCSTLAIYIYRHDCFGNFVMDKIIAGHKDRITSVTWYTLYHGVPPQACLIGMINLWYYRNPVNKDLIASSSIENRILIWDVVTERNVKSFTTAETPTTLDWCPHDPSLIAYGTDTGKSRAIRILVFAPLSTLSPAPHLFCRCMQGIELCRGFNKAVQHRK